jgi:hypothetical protein
LWFATNPVAAQLGREPPVAIAPVGQRHGRVAVAHRGSLPGTAPHAPRRR